MRNILTLMLVISSSLSVTAQEAKPQKYALLAAVQEYEHPDMNQPLLQYPEIDAKSMKDLLKEAGYEVDVLVGKQATQANIRKKLAGFSEKGINKGVIVVGLFGHGIEFDSTKKSYFCPYDTSLKGKRDSQGRPISDDNGKAILEPDANKLISIDEVLLAFSESKASNRILLADCCRNDPNAARGRSFGTSLGTNQLPLNTAVLFACSAQEKAYEHKDWGHGAFTKCLLDSIRENAARGKTLMGSIAEDVGESVEKLVKSKVTATQTPFLLSTGTRIDLQVAMLSVSKPLTPSSSTSSQPTKPKPSEPPKADETSSRGFEGTKAGDRKELNGIAFRWCPSGTFTMGTPSGSDDEYPVNVTLTSGFWLGETEVTQGQWQKFMGTTPWVLQDSVKKGEDYAASYISHDDAVAACDKFTKQEKSAGRLPKGWKYSLPTEAQWEYACRAGTTTKYSFGDSESKLSEYAWFENNAANVKEQYAHEVGKKKPNDWGLRDMHGNVKEWCTDRWFRRMSGGRDPVGPASGTYYLLRGGGFWVGAVYCRSASRYYSSNDAMTYDYGFRLAVVRVSD